MKKIRVLVTDDHSIVREGLKQFLNSQPDMEVIGEAGDGAEALEKIKGLHPDVVLLDITMPNITGLEVANLVRDTVPKTRIVIFSMHGKESCVRELLSSGVLGYVLKASPSSDILKAIRMAHRGEYFLSSKLKAEVIQKYVKGQGSAPSISGYDLLTEREQQVFRLVAQGHSTGKIADLLFISPKTVEKHRTSLMKKLDIHDRFELLKYAIKVGVVDPELWSD
ncbi:MAG: DNA-binding response regulator [Deltaproteobacteria bacterium HGW-Deltaproteobacteria-6]|jgi:two-component system response regulator NreC|nr:MAG: DNA-binding response regulator [Deltaproteobacteria bacterium HGW-Deltaproteobacteria-6]